MLCSLICSLNLVCIPRLTSLASFGVYNGFYIHSQLLWWMDSLDVTCISWQQVETLRVLCNLIVLVVSHSYQKSKLVWEPDCIQGFRLSSPLIHQLHNSCVCFCYFDCVIWLLLSCFFLGCCNHSLYWFCYSVNLIECDNCRRSRFHPTYTPLLIVMHTSNLAAWCWHKARACIAYELYICSFDNDLIISYWGLNLCQFLTKGHALFPACT